MPVVEGAARLGGPLAPARPARMTRCECAELSFEEVARRLREDRLTLEEVAERTGCGRLCTACLQDLHAHLAARR